jgi:putative protein-disulfide isomerase
MSIKRSLTIALVCIFCSVLAQKKNTMKDNSQNPLLCNPEKGICEVPSQGVAVESVEKVVLMAEKPIKVVYFTDPICSSCWGIEPQLRKLKLEYGDLVDIEYRMGGLLPSWDIYNSGGISKPSDVAHHWDEVSAHYDMPIDGDVWLTDPLPSSYPPSIAFKAAELQSHEKALLFLRKVREMVFLEQKNICKWEYLTAAATAVGLDVVQLKKDFEGKAKTDFEADLALGKQLGVRGFPTLFFNDANGNRLTVYGFRPYDAFEKALVSLLENAPKKSYQKDLSSLFTYYPTLTKKEFSVLANVTTQEAETLLNQGVTDKKLNKLTTKNGAIWRLKN